MTAYSSITFALLPTQGANCGGLVGKRKFAVCEAPVKAAIPGGPLDTQRSPERQPRRPRRQASRNIHRSPAAK